METKSVKLKSLIFGLNLTSLVEMGRMSDYDIRPISTPWYSACYIKNTKISVQENTDLSSSITGRIILANSSIVG